MKPGKLDIDIYRGDYFEVFFRLREQVYDELQNEYIAGDYIDLTGYTVTSQVRDAANENILATFTAAVGNQTTTPGSVLIYIAAASTAGLTPQVGVWDVQLTDTQSRPRTYLAGAANIIADVTR